MPVTGSRLRLYAVSPEGERRVDGEPLPFLERVAHERRNVETVEAAVVHDSALDSLLAIEMRELAGEAGVQTGSAEDRLLAPGERDPGRAAGQVGAVDVA